MEKYFVALIETASNQRYIFQSNKLRDVLGASELVRRAGEVFACEAIEQGGFAGRSEIVIATSGKAVVKFVKRTDAEMFVNRVTSRALLEAPGLGVFGAVSDHPISADAKSPAASDLMKALFDRVASNRLKLNDPLARFPFQPVVATCRTSALPAEGLQHGNEAASAMTQAKRKAARLAEDRLKKVFDGLAVSIKPEELEGCAWLAVVHADGNGFGKVFLELDKHLPSGATADAYFQFYRDFSRALEVVGEAATLTAARSLPADRLDGRRALMPLVMGGDDLTVIMDGALAIGFARAYAAAFERLVDQDNEFISGELSKNTPMFGVAAGVAIVKPHHPFWRAYELSEELVQSAKSTKKVLSPCISALDFHVVFGDSTSDLKDLRAPWSIGKIEGEKQASGPEAAKASEHPATHLTARPYVLSESSRYERLPRSDWASAHAILVLDQAVAELTKKLPDDEDGRLALPRSQQHVLRDAIFSGAETANARLQLIRHRYPTDFAIFGRDGKTPLFFQCTDEKNASGLFTRLLDALELNDVAGARHRGGAEQPTNAGN